jgi:hypothetical protein
VDDARRERALDDAPLSPGESLELAEAQRAAVARALGVDPVVLYATWGVAWCAGFGLLGLSATGTGVPLALSAVVFAALMAWGLVVTAVQSRRAGRGITGSSAMAGAFYGWSWLLGFAGLGAVISATARLTQDDRVFALLWPAGSGLLVGVLYMVGAAVWREPYQFGLGVWVLLTTTTGALIGVPGLYAVMSLAGGGGFLASAAVFAVRRSRR